MQDRERWKERFGRSRLVALGAGVATLLRAQDSLILLIEWDVKLRKVRTLMRRQAYPSEATESLPTPESLTAAYLALLGPASQGVTGQRYSAQT